jgi:glycosyltransferase involved in cell wall biosynthesis
VVENEGIYSSFHVKMPMHIVFITQNYPPSVCGIGDHTYFLAKALGERGYIISVICAKKPDIDVENATKEGISLYPIVQNWHSEEYTKVLQKIDILNPDWVFLQYEPYAFHPKGLPLEIVQFVRQLTKKNHKTLIFFHEIAVKWTFSLKLIPISIIQRGIANLLLRYAQQSVTSMAFYKKMFLKKGQAKVALQPIGSNIAGESQRNTFDDYPIQGKSVPLYDTETFNIVCFGGDGTEKGYTIILDAIKKLPFVHLIFIGKGEKIKQYALENDLTNRVHVTGIVNTEGVHHYMQMGDIFAMVHADIRGGIGFKSGSLAAGFNAGLPILGYKGAITETDILKHGDNCWLVDEATPKAFEKAITYLYSNKNILKKLSIGSQFFYKTHLHWDVLAKQYDAILRKEGNLIDKSTPSVLEPI